jgi:hypothetical protein
MPARMSEAALAAWRRAEEEQAFWDAHGAELVRQYPDQYIAVDAGQVVAASSDLQQVVAELGEKGLEPAKVWIRFLDAHPTTLVL